MREKSLGFITCPLCGCACGLNLLVQGSAADEHPCITVLPSSAPGWGATGLCMRGWQVGQILGSGRRLRSPMARRGGSQERVGWEEALAEFVNVLAKLCEDDAGSIGIILGDSLSNEDVFAARRFAGAIGTPNVATLGLELDAPVLQGIEQALGVPYRAPEPEELDGADVFLCVNSNFQHINPRAAGAMARRLQDGARMALIDEVDQGLAVWADVYARHRPGTRSAALRQVGAAIAGAGAGDGPLDAGDVGELVGLIEESHRLAVLFSTAAIVSTDEALALAELAQAIRGEARWVGLYLLPSGANTFGTIDMLAAGGHGPGGMSAMQMMSPGSALRCLIAIGEDLGRLLAPADLQQLRGRLEFAVSLSSVLSPTAGLADLALPMAMNAEHEGTVRQPDGRLWYSEQIVEPAGQAQTVGAVLSELSRALGCEDGWDSTDAMWERIRAEVPGYGHIRLDDLRAGELAQVGPQTAQVTEVVPAAVLTAPPVEMARTDEEHPFTLLPRSWWGGWTTDARCQSAHILRREATLYREPYVLLAPADAEELRLREGDRAQVSTRAGVATARVRQAPGIPERLALLPTEFPGLIRTVVGAADGEWESGLPVAPVAGAIRPLETG